MSEETKINEVVTEETPVTEENVMENLVHDPNAPIVTIKKLLEAGVHFGHQTKKWNPKMKPYIYCARNGIFIIDLPKSKAAIEESYLKLKEIVENGGKVLFVGTKDQAKEIVKEQAERAGAFYVNNRRLGGILTNFKTIQLRTRKLKELEAAEEDGALDKLPKKQASAIRKEMEKLSKNLEGIKEMRKIPNALIVVDPISEYNAVKEANKLNIPVFALCDTNCDPDNIDYVIPANDDATKSINLILTLLGDAICEAKGGLPEVAYTKDSGEDATMADALRQADRENALRIAARRELQRERKERELERQRKIQERRKSRTAKAPIGESIVENDAEVEASEEATEASEVETTTEE